MAHDDGSAQGGALEASPHRDRHEQAVAADGGSATGLRRAGGSRTEPGDAAAPSVAELTQCLVALGDPSLLESPLPRVISAIEDADTRELFEHVASDHRGYNLLSILRFNELDPWVARTCTAREATLVRAQLQRWIERASVEAPPLAQRLLETLQHSRGAGEPAPLFRRQQGPQVDVRHARVHAELCSDARQAEQGRFGVFRCELSLQGFEHAPLRAHCSCEDPADPAFHCCHVRALSAQLLNTLYAADSPVRRALQAVCGTPSWVRFFAALGAPEDKVTQAPTAAAERLCFRLRVRSDGSLGVTPIVQRRARNGGYSKGARVALSELADSLQADPLTQLALGLLRAITPDKTGEHAANLALLRVLTGHPSLIGEDHSLLALEESRVELSFDERPGGWLADAKLGGTSLSALRELPRGDHLGRVGTQGRLWFAALPEALARWLWGMSQAQTVLPTDCSAQLRQRLRELQPHANLRLPPELLGEPDPELRRLLLRLENNPGEGVRVSLHSRPLHAGPVFTPGEGPREVLGERAGKPCYALRDLAWERAKSSELLHVLQLTAARELSPLRYSVDSQEAALALIERVARAREVLEIEWLEGHRPLKLLAPVQRADLKLKIGHAERWFEASGHAQLADGQQVSLVALLDAARLGQRYVQVAADTYVALHDELRGFLERAAEAVFTEREKLKLAAIALPKLFALTELAHIERAPSVDTLITRMQHAETAPCELPEPLASRLRPYQREGVRFLLRLSSWATGACLADEMGLGKTVQTLTVLIARQQLGPALVIAPTSVGHNWCAEAARFAPELRVRLYRGDRRSQLRSKLGPGDVLVTSYELATADRAALSELRFATLVLDEAHMLKNAGTERARAIAGLDADFRIALTGTPVENHLGELWSLMAQLNPGLLGNFSQFRARFGLPIERYGDQERLSVLRQIVSPFVLRRDKRSVAPELPARIELTRSVVLSPAERSLYDAAVSDLRKRIDDRKKFDLDRVEVLAEITKLRQLACHPRLVVSDWHEPSSKLRTLLALVEEILPLGHRALVFSQFVTHLRLVQSALSARGLPCLYLDGSTKASERAQLVDRWQAGETSLFLISLKAGGTGLNLSKADYVVHLDPWWNPAAEDQAADRAHRIGSDRPVTIVRLIAQDTVEEKVAALHEDKRELAQAMLQETGARRLAFEQLSAYLGLAPRESA
jgi:superfamily II DNA or RNA helicase